jgi:hypothetical protein
LIFSVSFISVLQHAQRLGLLAPGDEEISRVGKILKIPNLLAYGHVDAILWVKYRNITPGVALQTAEFY